VVNNASTFEQDSAASFGFAALDKHLHSNTGAAVLLAQALHAHIAARGGEGAQSAEGAQGAVVNLLDQKLWNQNPDFFSYTLSKAALEAAGTMLALALAPLVRVVGVAPGLTLTSHLLSDAQFEASAQAVAAGPLLHAGRRCGHGQIRAGKPLHHRHHAAGGRRPAPDEVRTRFFADVNRGTG
jgi:NAD(P)-dependent dehydrogenase (short-subunit alcohol dehydrogenase family)